MMIQLVSWVIHLILLQTYSGISFWTVWWEAENNKADESLSLSVRARRRSIRRGWCCRRWWVLQRISIMRWWCIPAPPAPGAAGYQRRSSPLTPQVEEPQTLYPSLCLSLHLTHTHCLLCSLNFVFLAPSRWPYPWWRRVCRLARFLLPD